VLIKKFSENTARFKEELFQILSIKFHDLLEFKRLLDTLPSPVSRGRVGEGVKKA